MRWPLVQISRVVVGLICLLYSWLKSLIIFWIPINFLSNFLIAGIQYGTV